jgi:cytidine deaminase
VIDREQLLEMAARVRENAHAPYSDFRVGAALLTKGGTVYTGCNIESAAFSPTICAERVALGAAIAAGAKPGDFEAIAVVADSPEPTTPCGVCRQLLRELAPGIRVIMAAAPELGSGRLELGIEDLLPHGFTSFKIGTDANRRKATDID